MEKYLHQYYIQFNDEKDIDCIKIYSNNKVVSKSIFMKECDKQVSDINKKKKMFGILNQVIFLNN